MVREWDGTGLDEVSWKAGELLAQAAAYAVTEARFTGRPVDEPALAADAVAAMLASRMDVPAGQSRGSLAEGLRTRIGPAGFGSGTRLEVEDGAVAELDSEFRGLFAEGSPERTEMDRLVRQADERRN